MCRFVLLIGLLAVVAGCEAIRRYDEGAQDAALAQKKQEIAQLKTEIDADAAQGKVDVQKFAALAAKIDEVRQLLEQKSQSRRWDDLLFYVLGGVAGYPIARLIRRIPVLGAIIAMGDPTKKPPALKS